MTNANPLDPLVSVVVPNWNGLPFIGETLDALRAQRFQSFETIVVDNGSTDGSADWICKGFPWAVVHRLDHNFGFAAAANEGARRAEGQFLAFLNSDAAPRPSWLEELTACINRHPNAAVADAKLLRFGQPDVIDGAGDAVTWSLKAYRRGSGEPAAGRFETEEELFAASATACLWRAEAFHRLGGFDERFFAYYEDVDLSFRARNAGYECWFAPRAVALHRGGSSAGSAARRLESFESVRNRWAMIVKNVPAAWLLRKGHVILAGEVLSVARAAARGDLLMHLKAYAAVLRCISSWRLSRQEIRRGGCLTLAAARPLVESNFPPVGVSLNRRRWLYGARLATISARER